MAVQKNATKQKSGPFGRQIDIQNWNLINPTKRGERGTKQQREEYKKRKYILGSKPLTETG